MNIIAVPSSIYKITIPSTFLEFDATKTIASDGSLTNEIGNDWIVVRNSVASYQPTANTIINVLANVPRIVDGKVLIESSAACLLSDNEEINTWTVRGEAVVTTDDIIAPDGTLTAEKLYVKSNSNDVYQNGSTIGASASFELSLWIKRVSIEGSIVLSHPASGTGEWAVAFGLLSDNWELLTKNHAAVTVNESWAASGSGVAGLWFRDNESIGRTFHVWRPVQEITSVTSSIKSATAPTTREADVITITVPTGATQAETWIDGVSDGGQTVTAGATFTMLNGTTKIIMT